MEMAEEGGGDDRLPAGSDMEGTGKSDPGESEEEDVYEVERIIDYKVEKGQTIYRVRWKGYTSDDDTWEPEAHLEDCREVLLQFKKKTTESKVKPAKKEKETQKLNLSTDIFDAESEGDWRPDSEDEIPVRKKKKKVREIRDDDDSDGVKKKKSKSVKSKETITSDDELSDDLNELTSGKESKSKKRNLEFLEDTASTKKRKKEERKKVKKDTDDNKKKHKDVSKDKKKRKKEKESDTILESKQSSDDSDIGTADHVMDVQDKTEEEKVETKTETKTEKALEETSEVEETASKQEPVVANAEEEVPDVKEKEKKKKDKKIEQQEQISLPKNKEESLDKKNLKKDSHNKKQKHQEKSTVLGDSDKGSNVAAKVQKTPKVSVEETAPKFAAITDEDSAKKSKKPNETDSVNKSSVKEMESPISAAKEKGVSKLGEDGKGKEKTPGLAASSLFEKFSVESEGDKAGQKTAENSSLAEKGALEKVDDTKVTPKVQDKVAKTEVPKEIPAKKKDSEKDEKGKKEQKIEKKELKIESAKDLKGIFGAFRKHPEDHSRQLQKNEKTEDVPNFRYTPEIKAKETKPMLKERRDTRDDDSWLYGPSEVTHVVQDTVSQTEENPDAKQQVLSLGLDLQLEWMKLESFQKHIDGEDEVLSTTENISNSALREAVKNGDYLSVKIALNSKEEYNLDQEDSSGMTLVMLAAASGQDDILRLLIKKGAKLNARQKTGTTALIHAAEKNFLTTVAILLEAGALVNAQQISGETALMKACKRGNADIVRLMLEYGADCSILSKHQNSALHYAKQSNNVMLYDLLRNHMDTLSRVAEDTIRDYFEARLTILEPVFPIACHRLCEGPDFSMDFTYKPPQNAPEGSGILLFIFHANFFSGSEIVARLCGPCSVQAVILNDKFQLPVFLDSHFIYSFSPVTGPNKLFIRLTEAPTAKVKLLICAYRVQLN